MTRDERIDELADLLRSYLCALVGSINRNDTDDGNKSVKEILTTISALVKAAKETK